jgi:hypothetical protein
MAKRITSIFVSALLGLIFSFQVQAMPMSPIPQHEATPLITPVRGFCGLGFHRGPYGYCVRNGVPYYGYMPPPLYPPPPVVVGVPRVCPWGFYIGPYGRCYQY